ncbi:hypothetical protein FXO38_00952 [Capsicum annuum]|nr:hypothetical protein FXO38_00952 [Capsicum annuum]
MDKKGFRKYKPKSRTRETFESGHSGILLWAAGLVAGTNSSVRRRSVLWNFPETGVGLPSYQLVLDQSCHSYPSSAHMISFLTMRVNLIPKYDIKGKSDPRLVGKDALAETDKITLETAKLLREDYLAQNAFTPYDKFCPFYKSVWMLRNIIHFYNLANQAVERAAGMDGQKITYTLIKHRLGDLFYRLVSQKFEDPAEGEDVLVAKFQKLHDDLIAGFRNLEDETR